MKKLSYLATGRKEHMMAKEYRIMMKLDGKWWKAHINCRMARITNTYEDAVKELERIKDGRLKWKHPAESYKIMSREVTDWIDE